MIQHIVQSPHSRIYKYVIMYWGYHAQRCSTPNQGLLDFLQDDNLIRNMMINVHWIAGVPLNVSEPPVIHGVHLAAIFGLCHILRCLLKTSDPSQVDGMGVTPLSYAIINGHEGAVRVLLDSGANVNGASIDTDECIEYGQTVPNFWLDIDTRRDSKIKDMASYVTPVIKASICGHESILRLLVEKGARVDVTDDRGMTPLTHAILKRHIAIVEFLYPLGSHIFRMADANGRMPLHYAMDLDYDAEVVEALFTFGNPPVDHQDQEGFTLLMLAASCGKERIVNLLIAHGAKTDLGDKHGATPLTYAVIGGHIAVVETLLQCENQDIGCRDAGGRTLLIHAAFHGHIAMLEFLLEHGDKNIDIADDQGHTPLIYAAVNGQAAMVQLLLEKGADPSVKNEEALQVAMKEKHYQVVELLFLRRINANESISGGEPLIQHALKEKDNMLAKILLKHAPNISEEDRSALNHIIDECDGMLAKLGNKKAFHSDERMDEVMRYCRSRRGFFGKDVEQFLDKFNEELWGVL